MTLKKGIREVKGFTEERGAEGSENLGGRG